MNDSHFLSVFVSFDANNAFGYNTFLSAMSPICDE